jgi:amidase
LPSPLHGIPILLKDNIATDDGLNNTAGSYALLGAKPREDSTVAAKLRRSGAIILGKANLSQWAGMRGANVSEGWSAYGGQTTGAYFPDQEPSGSSSGSAVAASVGLAWACLGTETAGSIVDPAHVNNIVGIKPTVGLTSRYMVVPISEHQDSVGPMARTVKDAAHLLSIIAGSDPKDNYTSASPFGENPPDYVAACKKTGLKGKRLGVLKNIMDLDQDVTSQPAVDVFDETLDILRAAGAEIIEGVYFPGIKPILEHKWSTRVAGQDFLTDLPRYLGNLKTNPHNITTLEQLRDFTHRFPGEGYPDRTTVSWDRVLGIGYDNTSPEWWSNYTTQLYYATTLGLQGALKNHSLDAMVMPTMYASMVAAMAGTPVITVPLGRAPDRTPVQQNEYGTMNVTGPNQPFGLGFAGGLFSEETLIEIAYSFEQITVMRDRVLPLIQPTSELGDVVDGRLEL